MIEIKNLSFGYAKRDRLFTNLTFRLNKGGICGLLGKNGSGKTTLLKLISGLLFHQQGNCQVLEKTPAQRCPSFLAEIYFLPEDIFVPSLSADEYLQLYAIFYPRFDQTLFYNCLNEFGLPTNKLLTQFSHGQKKKFLLSFGLATQCRLLILDEPTNGLDIPSKAQFRKLLASIISDEKLIIISTHQVHDVENLIDSILILDEGKIIFNQSLLQVTHHFAFTQQQIEPDMNNCLYAEKRLGGYIVVTMNNHSQDEQVDLEALFNAILVNKMKIQKFFDEVKSR